MVLITTLVPRARGGEKQKNGMVPQNQPENGCESKLPAEIILGIASHLPKEDWKTLRLVCKEFYNAMTDMPLITSLWFSPHSEDIEVFFAVCNHESLGRYVNTIYYDTFRFPDSLEQIITQWKILQQHEKALEFSKRMDHQKRILENEEEILTNNLRKLPRVSKINFKHSLSGRASSSPFAQYMNSKEYPWLRGRRDWQTPDITLSHVTPVICAMASIGPSINELNFARDYNTVARDLFSIEGPLFETAKTVFQNLRSFSIRFHEPRFYNPSTGARERLGEGFLKLFHCAKKLERTYLDGNNITLFSSGNGVDELAVLFPPGDPDDYTKPALTFPHLKALDLFYWSANPESIKRILGNHSKSLKWLNLDTIALNGAVGMRWPPMLEFIKNEMSLEAVNIVFNNKIPRHIRRLISFTRSSGAQLQLQAANSPNPAIFLAMVQGYTRRVSPESFTQDSWWTVTSQDMRTDEHSELL